MTDMRTRLEARVAMGAKTVPMPFLWWRGEEKEGKTQIVLVHYSATVSSTTMVYGPGGIAVECSFGHQPLNGA